jgi:hypothetical protein
MTKPDLGRAATFSHRAPCGEYFDTALLVSGACFIGIAKVRYAYFLTRWRAHTFSAYASLLGTTLIPMSPLPLILLDPSSHSETWKQLTPRHHDWPSMDSTGRLDCRSSTTSAHLSTIPGGPYERRAQMSFQARACFFELLIILISTLISC